MEDLMQMLGHVSIPRAYQLTPSEREYLAGLRSACLVAQSQLHAAMQMLARVNALGDIVELSHDCSTLTAKQ
jgi:hypothetical protein